PERKAGSPATVPGHTLPEFMRIAGFAHVDLLKLDIEGAEHDVLAAPTGEWLPRVRYLVIELHDQIKPGCSDKFNAAIAGIPHRIDRQMQNTVWHNLACPPGP
ncbi:MAG: FkbM family methyltransferase, partial [Pseudomonadota bacterium]